MKTRTRIGLVALALSSVVACGEAPTDGSSDADGGVKVVTSSNKFLAESLTDWVSYSTEVALVTITDERDQEPNADVVAWGEGYVSRSVTAKVDRVLWRAGGSLHAPEQFTFNGQGYVVGKEGRQQAVTPGSPRLTPGEQYVMPISYHEGVFGPLSSASPIKVQDGVAKPLPQQDDEAVQALAGKDANQIVSILAKTRGDAMAAKHSNLEPYERVRAVVQERRRQQEAAHGK